MSNSKINARLRRFLRSREGNIAIITALMLPVLVGFCGLASETAYWYYRHRDIQGAADLAAYGGAAVLRSGGTSTAAVTAATADAVTNGWQQANGTIAVNSPPTSGTNAGNDRAVQVILTENQQRYFTRIYFGNTTQPINVRSTAIVVPAGPACILGLNPSASGTVEFWGNATANLTACNVATNSNNASGFKQGGSSTVWVPCAYTMGTSQTTAGLHLTGCGSVVEHHPPTPDPYAGVPAPAYNPADCVAQPAGGVLAPGCYNGLHFQNTPVILTGGMYIVRGGGGFDMNANADVRCVPVSPETGCTFFLTEGATISNINGNAHIEMKAPTSGTYAGLAFYGDRTQATATNQFNGNATSNITGALYFPSQKIAMQGNFTGTNGCMQMIADVIYYTGNGTFTNNCSAYGIKTVQVPGAISLAE